MKIEFELIPSNKCKRALLMAEQYTFYQLTNDNRYWTCSRRTSSIKCKAKIRFDRNGKLKVYDRNHNHEPPRFFKTNEEVLIKGDTENAQFIAVMSKDKDITYDSTDEDEAMFVESKRGKTLLQYKGHRYRKAYTTKHGIRWTCSFSNNCHAFVYLNSDDEIIMTNETHNHPKTARLERVDDKPDDVAVVITSRKGKELLLFRQFTYRKQYIKHNKTRWVCSSAKNCRGVIFTDDNNVVKSAFEEHCHSPPKYYLKADNVIGALREPLFFESYESD